MNMPDQTETSISKLSSKIFYQVKFLKPDVKLKYKKYDNFFSGKLRSAFDILPGSETMGMPYDFYSVMHYGLTSFSKNGEMAMVPIKKVRFKEFIE